MLGPAPPSVGPFRTGALLGRGGTSDVWRARHESGAEVALKVLRAQLAADPAIVEAVKTEVEAVARLEHPSIALVLDFGFVTSSEAASSAGALASGAPWLALELASGGTLASLRATTWSALRDTLSLLLGALAHAHARGFIHRDLKPANVLVCGDEDPRPGLKLTDFGLARALDGDGRSAEGFVAGTPAYMSPEQFRVDDAALGPWTDLYALGCLAFSLVTGAPPFAGSGKELVRAHVLGERPSLPPLPGAPSALGAWLRRLLEPEPRARFPTAADARYALHALDGSEPPDPRARPSGLVATTGGQLVSSVTPPVSSLGSEHPTEGWQVDEGLAGAPTRVRGARRDLDGPALAGLVTSGSRSTSSGVERTLPSTWRSRYDVEAGSVRGPLLGAGLGLYGIREVPVSGRERERDALWQALVDVHREGRSRAVVLRGHAGTGKSRLAAWLCQRAHEVGGVRSLRAEHAPSTSSTEALARMVARFVGVAPTASAADAVEHLRRWARVHGLHDDDVPAVASLLPSSAAEGSAPSAADRDARLTRLLEVAALDRPVIAWLDDAQWGPDAPRFVEHALARAPSALFLLTVREDALDDARAREGLTALERRDDVTTLSIAPLQPQEHRALVADLLHLAPELAARVVGRTLGNPLFAVQLVGDWVQRGLLTLGPRGFEVRPGADVRLPDALHEVWSSHVERLCASLPEGARAALELAAILGPEVAPLEWRAACALVLPDASFLDELTGEMVRARLAERRASGGWSFSHGALRESVERGAREAGRLERHHGVVATALADVYGAGAAGVSERVGVHLFHARQHEAALEPLLASARDHVARGEQLEALRVLDLYDEAVAALALSPDDARRAEPMLLRARASVDTGAPFEVALRAAGHVHRRREQPGWDREQPAAWLLRAYVSYRRNLLDEAARDYRYARGWARRVGDEASEVRALLGLGDVEYYLGDRRSAGRRYREALPLADRRGDVRLTVRSLWSLGYVELWAGRLPRARRLFERQLELCQSEGDAIGVGRALSSLGEVERQSGNLDEAERMQREALVPFVRAGAVRSAAVGRLNLLSLDVMRGRFASARHGIERLLPELLGLDEPQFAAIAHALLAATALGLREVDAADEHLAEAERLLAERWFVEGDLAEALEQVGRQAHALGLGDLARRALTLAREQWVRVGREEHAATLPVDDEESEPGAGA